MRRFLLQHGSKAMKMTRIWFMRWARFRKKDWLFMDSRLIEGDGGP